VRPKPPTKPPEGKAPPPPPVPKIHIIIEHQVQKGD
jgi:hypothetical protein